MMLSGRVTKASKWDTIYKGEGSEKTTKGGKARWGHNILESLPTPLPHQGLKGRGTAFIRRC